MKRIRQVEWSGDTGEGTIFFFVDSETKKKVSKHLYISYRAERKEILVSAKTEDLADAKRELKRLTRSRDNAGEGIAPLATPKLERVTVADLLDANLRRCEAEKLASVCEIRYRTGTLKALLGPIRAVEFRPEHVDQYRERRRKGDGTLKRAKAGATSIRRELEILNRAFRYAVQRKAIAFAPYIELPEIDNVSEIEFPPERVGELVSRLRKLKTGDPLPDLVEFMSLTARRPEGLRNLTWSQFDSETWTLKIRPEKKGNAVMIGLSGALREIIERRLAARRLGCDLIFHRSGRHMRDEKDRALFAGACAEMGLAYGRDGGFTIYTVKSTAVGLMNDAGLSHAEIKDRSGHKTDAMMLRYLKQRPERAHAASEKVELYLAAKREAAAEKRVVGAERVAVFPSVSEK